MFHPTSIQSHYTSVFTNREKVKYYVTQVCIYIVCYQAFDLYELWFTSDLGLIDPDQPVDPDPLASSNIRKLTSELDRVVGKQWNDRKYLEAYRTLLVRSLITQVLEHWSQCLIIEYIYKTAMESGRRGMEHAPQYGGRVGTHSILI